MLFYKGRNLMDFERESEQFTLKIESVLNLARSVRTNLCRLIQTSAGRIDFSYEHYFCRWNFNSNLVNSFATLSKAEITNSRVMSRRACVHDNDAIVAALVSELNTKDVCVVTIDLSVENLLLVLSQPW